jgi:hypothetical protein
LDSIFLSNQTEDNSGGLLGDRELRSTYERSPILLQQQQWWFVDGGGSGGGPLMGAAACIWVFY